MIKTSNRNGILFLFPSLLLFAGYLHAQYNPENGFIDAHFGKPVTFTSRDSTFSLGIGGRIQSLAEARIDRKTDQNSIDFFIRRLRLNFAGNAISKKFTYRIQLCFSQRDVASDNSLVQNNLFLRDAMLFYSPSRHWKFGFGQTKLPGNRQRQVSSGNLQLVDRSNTNALFTLDRDKGFWVTYTTQNRDKAIFTSTLAITSGEGRINSDRTDGLCYSFRSEFLPLGEFKSGGDFVEADIFHEDKPRLSLAAVYSYNNRTSRIAGQLGEYLYNNQLANIHYYGADLAFKYHGWSLFTELYRRVSPNGISVNPADAKVRYVFSGTGFLLQSGFLLSDKNELAARYAFTDPDRRIGRYTDRLREWILGYSHYFFRHNLKLQGDLGFFQSRQQEFVQARFTGIVTF